MSDLELFPSHDTARSNLVRLHLEPTVLVAEKMCLLSENPGQDSHDGPTKETAIGRRVASVEEGILFL